MLNTCEFVNKWILVYFYRRHFGLAFFVLTFVNWSILRKVKGRKDEG